MEGIGGVAEKGAVVFIPIYIIHRIHVSCPPQREG
nr:MAG TPA: hypothetical protein [Bacteriophage sp.]